MFLKIIKRIIWKWKLHCMDEWWVFMGGAHYDLFPPSYYATHTPEEAREEGHRRIAELRKQLEEYERKYVKKDPQPENPGNAREAGEVQ